jgi:hypothetical protein
VGTRDARPFSGRGFETGLWLDYVPVDGAGLRFSNSYLFSAGLEPRAAVFVEGSWLLLRNERQGMDLGLGFGFGRDFRDAWLPRIRVFLGAKSGRFEIAAGVLAEFPMAAGRDAMDVIITAAAGYRIADSWIAGVEAAAEDLEGFFEEEEAEGGARLTAGPTLWVQVTDSWHIKANVAACITGRLQDGTRELVDPGVAARLAVGYSF